MIGLIDNFFDRLVFPSFTRLGYQLRHPFWRKLEVDLTEQVALVTGANSGIGMATAEALAAYGAEVWMLVRSRERGEHALESIRARTGSERLHLEVVDMSSQKSIRAFVQRFKRKSRRLDILVNNAAVLLHRREESVDGIEMTLATNTLGYYLLTELLTPVLERSAPARVINVSSGGMYAARVHPEDLQYESRVYDGVKAYAETKRAEVVLAQAWARQHRGIFFASMHPGWVDTPGVKRSLPLFYKIMRPLLRTPAQGADTIVWLATCPDLTLRDSGKFWFDRKTRPEHILSSTRNTDGEIAEFLHECLRLTDRFAKS